MSEGTFSDVSAQILNRRKMPYFTSVLEQTDLSSVHPDQTPENAASDQGLHCLPLTQQFFAH